MTRIPRNSLDCQMRLSCESEARIIYIRLPKEMEGVNIVQRSALNRRIYVFGIRAGPWVYTYSVDIIYRRHLDKIRI